MAYQADIADLLGTSDAAEKRRKKAADNKRQAERRAAVKAARAADIEQPATIPAEQRDDKDFAPEMLRYTMPPTITELHSGVSVTFLATLFGMAKATVVKRLRQCDPVRRMKNAPVYDFRQACAYLVEPRIDIGEYLRTLRPEEMPSRLQKDFWDAQLKRQKWAVEAGDLWHTEDVREVFGEVFKRLKTTIQLWSDEIDRIQGLTDEQRAALAANTDALQEELFAALMRMPEDRETRNVAENVDEEGMPIPRAAND